VNGACLDSDTSIIAGDVDKRYLHWRATRGLRR
jgi:hypothetical protein